MLLKHEFLWRKKDSGDKSRNGEDTKKIRENNSNSLSDEIFEYDINSPECAKIFSNHLKQIESDAKKLFELGSRKTPALEFLSNKIPDLKLCNFMIRRLLHRCNLPHIHVEYCKIFEKSFFYYMRKVKMFRLKLQTHCNISLTNLMKWKKKIRRKMKRYLN